jgi:hypothetical protein
MANSNIVSKFYKNLKISRLRPGSFGDIYWELFGMDRQIDPDDINQIFKINRKTEGFNFFSKFEHIYLTGGANVNDTFKNKALGDIFQIPSFEEIWENARTAKIFLPANSKKILSAHYLHGSRIVSEMPVKSFSFIRDPRKLLISALQSDDPISSEENLNHFWRKIEKKLISISKDVKHANYQLYELATKNSEKKFPYEHGKSVKLFNLENIKGTEPKALREKVENRLNNDLFFIGITENLSESLVILFELLGLSEINLWSPGLYSFKKLTFEEAPNSVKDLISNLCQLELEFYLQQRNQLEKLVENSMNKEIITRYVVENKRPDLKFLQGIKERLDLATAVSGIDKSRLQAEVTYWKTINNQIKKVIVNAASTL